MNTSGLIFAVVVGLWAAYLVPMWLRRQDELNESRPTERFTTAIRLLSGRAGLERRTARDTERRRRRAATEETDPDAAARDAAPGDAEWGTGGEIPPVAVPDLRGYADPVTEIRPQSAPSHADDAQSPVRARHDRRDGRHDSRPGTSGRDHHDAGPGREATPAREVASGHDGAHDPEDLGGGGPPAPRPRPDASTMRARVLARRRRTTMILFLAFALSGILSLAAGRVSLWWVPAVPGALLTAYIWHLRKQERRRYAMVMDRRRAEEAARRLHEGARSQPAEPPARPAPSPAAAGRRALVEETDHAEWVDEQRQPGATSEDADGWEPAPVPLPTYVSAPVAPRHTRNVDLDAPDTWSSARSTTAGSGSTPHATGPQRTPLFDQYADEENRPRAAGE